MVQTTHPHFQLTKRERAERCTRQRWLELARNGKRQKECVWVSNLRRTRFFSTGAGKGDKICEGRYE